MLLKTILIYVSIIIFVFIVDYPQFVKGDLGSQDVKDVVPGLEPTTLHGDFNYNERGNATNASTIDIIGAGNGSFVQEVAKSNYSSTGNSTVHVSCILKQNQSGFVVEIVNASKLTSLLHIEQNITSRQMPGSCVIVLFYSPSCPFSCMAAPHFNALPRFFHDLKMVAIDAMMHRNINAQFGIVGTPTLMLFHNGRLAATFNETSEYGLELFSSFITKHTGILPEGKLVVTSTDFGGPVSSVPVRETDYYLLLSWLVIAARIFYSFYYSTWGRSLVDATLNAWREAEAQHHQHQQQHQHVD